MSSSPSLETAAMRAKTRPFLDLVKASWEAIEGERPRFFLFIFLFVLSCATDLLLPWVIGHILQIFEKDGITETTFRLSLYSIAGYVGLRLLNTLFHHTARYVQNTVTYIARMQVLEKLFNTFMRFPINWHVGHHSGENLSRLYRSAGAVENTIGTYVWQVVEGIVKVFFAATALFLLDTFVASCVLGLSLMTVAFMIFFNKRLTNRIRKNFGFANKINRICVDYLVNIITVKTLGLEKAASKYLSSQKMEGLNLSKKISKYSELKWCTTSVGHGVITGASLLLYFYSNKNTGQPFQIGAVYVLLSYLDRIFGAIGSFTGYYGGLVEASTGYEDASKLFVEIAEIDEEKTEYLKIDNWQKLSISNLNYSYPGNEKTGLLDLAVEVTKGDKIALVGPSGGGKSTFLKILAGLLTPESYSIKAEGKELSIDSISSTSILIPQEPEIFSESLFFNLTMGELIADETVKKFTNLCRLDAVISKLPNGWNTDLAEKGLNLSVGEKQRVAIARGLLRVGEKNMLLLDEPTSSLDPNTEKQVFMNLIEYYPERTIITACHRLNLVPLFNKIIYIEQGKIEEVGGFNELINKGGYFAKAWTEYQKKMGKDDQAH